MHKWGGWIFVLWGCVLVIHGLTAKHFIFQGNFPASKEEQEKFPATWKQRTAVVVVGVALLLFGVVLLFSWI